MGTVNYYALLFLSNVLIEYRMHVYDVFEMSALSAIRYIRHVRVGVPCVGAEEVCSEPPLYIIAVSRTHLPATTN